MSREVLWRDTGLYAQNIHSGRKGRVSIGNLAFSLDMVDGHDCGRWCNRTFTLCKGLACRQWPACGQSGFSF